MYYILDETAMNTKVDSEIEVRLTTYLFRCILFLTNAPLELYLKYFKE